ncbi:MAG: FeoB small GTPase domain-containing protein [Dehalococcoidales bacterium]
MNKKRITVALVGNPNSGKTTLFNSLTGSTQHVGNWPGVTVEKKEGTCSSGEYEIKVVDLPGVYSLTAYSPDEVIARKFIIEEKPDVVVDIVDASNLERNLYLSVQLMELDVPVLLALNMMDEAENRNHKIDIKKLSEGMGLPVVPMVANKSKGVADLLAAVVKIVEDKNPRTGVKIEYGRDVEKQIGVLEKALSESPHAGKYSPHWLAIKLLEGDEEIIKKFEGVPNVK